MSPPDFSLELPQHLAQDPGLTALINTFHTLLKFSEDAADIINLVQSYSGLVAEATRVMKKPCTGSYPIAQGGFNLVFLLTFEAGTDALARLRAPSIPALSSDALTHQFNSEVATIAFVREHTSIPVPELYHYEPDPNNALGTPYMLMSRIPGECLATRWHLMSQREEVLRAVAHIEAQLLQAPFPVIGSIADKDGLVGLLAPSSTHADSLLVPHRQGPFLSSKRLMEAYLSCELSLLGDHSQWTLQRTCWCHINGGVDDMTVAYATRWFSLLLAVTLASEEFDNPTHFTLYHDDLSLNNILVLPLGNVVGLVDWRGSRVRALWDATLHSHFLQVNLIDDQQELPARQRIQQDVIFKETGLRPGTSPLCLSYLLHISTYSHSVRSSRNHLDSIFLNWFAAVVSTGYEEKLDPFLPLKLFIEAHRTRPCV
ncbi:kinase-like domain-containing protein [Mycena galericulata]|nr:kinase-like domain-containing protein [Mycena galericulata]